MLKANASSYADHLEARKRCGEIAWYAYEAITLTISHSTKGGARGSRITIDFFVMLNDGLLEAHEVKGFRDKRQVNALKAAAELYPFRFVLLTKRLKRAGGGWSVQEV